MEEFSFEECDESDEQFVKSVVKDVVIRKKFSNLDHKKAPIINILDELRKRHGK